VGSSISSSFPVLAARGYFETTAAHEQSLGGNIQNVELSNQTESCSPKSNKEALRPAK
jgi:hypothetical protein